MHRKFKRHNQLDSGFAPYIPNEDSFGDPYDPYPAFGQIGQTTSNYFDVASSQGTLGTGVTLSRKHVRLPDVLWCICQR